MCNPTSKKVKGLVVGHAYSEDCPSEHRSAGKCHMRYVGHCLKTGRFPSNFFSGYPGHHVLRRNAMPLIRLNVMNIVRELSQLRHAIDANANPTAPRIIDGRIFQFWKDLSHFFVHNAF